MLNIPTIIKLLVNKLIVIFFIFLPPSLDFENSYINVNANTNISQEFFSRALIEMVLTNRISHFSYFTGLCVCI